MKNINIKKLNITRKKAIFIMLLIAACIALTTYALSMNRVRTITGIVTKISIDCGETVELIDGVETVNQLESNLCDAGSFVTIDDTRIKTATGFEEEIYYKHPSDLKLGETVSATYIREQSGQATLNCESCEITKK